MAEQAKSAPQAEGQAAPPQKTDSIAQAAIAEAKKLRGEFLRPNIPNVFEYVGPSRGGDAKGVHIVNVNGGPIKVTIPA